MKIITFQHNCPGMLFTVNNQKPYRISNQKLHFINSVFSIKVIGGGFHKLELIPELLGWVDINCHCGNIFDCVQRDLCSEL